MKNEGVASHNIEYAEGWSNVDTIRLKSRTKEITRALKILSICENVQRTAPILVVGPGIGADGVAIRSQFPSAHLTLLDVDFRAQAAAKSTQLENFSFVQVDLVANKRNLEVLLQSNSFDLCFALRSSSEIVLSLIADLENQSIRCTFVFSLIVNTEPPDLLAAVKNKIKELNGKSHYLVEGRAFTEQGFIVTIAAKKQASHT